MSSKIARILLQHTALLFLLSACGGLPVDKPLAAANIADLALTAVPDVAAEFNTTHTDEDGHDVQTVWRGWRDGKQVIIEKPQLQIGESWQRDGKSITQRTLYHGDRRAIEFQHDDLRILEASPSWQRIVLLLDPRIPESLAASAIESPDGYPTREYHGRSADAEWRIVMRADLALPMLIERRHGQSLERTELLNAYPLAGAPWRPTPADGYDVIDFADLGDKEQDPFVAKVLARMGHGH